MRLYRVAQLAYAMDLSGEGARLYGGRWTPAGLPAVYVSEHPALCAFELLVHNGIRIASRPLGFRLVGIDLPDRTRIERVMWLPDEPLQVGEQWLRSQHTALLRVPSVVMPHSWNFIVNPRHPEAAEAQGVDLGLMPFDRRIANR